MIISGSDEAGRGPVIGPLVMCAVSIDEKDEQKLKNIGVKDSKMIAPKVRERMFGQIKEVVKGYAIIVVTPAQVDSALNDPTLNLNKLEAITTAKLLNELKPDKAFIDSPSNNPSAYKEYLQQFLEKEIDLVVEPKADVNYPVAAAASILAKVTRDQEVEKIRQKYGNCGSGYPSDPLTKEFLAKNWNVYPEIFRKTWAPYKNIEEKQAQKGLDNF